MVWINLSPSAQSLPPVISSEMGVGPVWLCEIQGQVAGASGSFFFFFFGVVRKLQATSFYL